MRGRRETGALPRCKCSSSQMRIENTTPATTTGHGTQASPCHCHAFCRFLLSSVTGRPQAGCTQNHPFPAFLCDGRHGLCARRFTSASGGKWQCKRCVCLLRFSSMRDGLEEYRENAGRDASSPSWQENLFCPTTSTSTSQSLGRQGVCVCRESVFSRACPSVWEFPSFLSHTHMSKPRKRACF